MPNHRSLRVAATALALAVAAVACAEPDLGPPSSTVPQALEVNPTPTPEEPFEVPEPTPTPTAAPTPEADVTPTPGAEPALVPGLSDDAIRLAVVADVNTGSVGFDENGSVWNGMRAWAAAVNDAGGLAGRRVELDLIDTAAVAHAEAMAEVCNGEFFALVGGRAIDDGNGISTLLDPACSLPDFPAAALSPQRRESPITFVSNPFLLDYVQIGPDLYIADTVPGRAQRSAQPLLNLDTLIINGERSIEGASAAGLEFVFDDRVAFDADPSEVAAAIVESGARVLRWEADGERLIGVLRALEDIRNAPPDAPSDGGEDGGETDGTAPEGGGEAAADGEATEEAEGSGQAGGAQDQGQPGDGDQPDGEAGDGQPATIGPDVVICAIGCYSDAWLAEAGPLGEGVLVPINHAPIQEADTEFEMTNFVFWMGQLDDGPALDGIALEGWMAGRLFEAAVDAAAAPLRDDDVAPLTGELVLDAARTIDIWDVNGLQGVASPAERDPSPCFALMAVRDGEWVRIHPFGRGRLDCAVENVFELVDTRDLGLAGDLPTPEPTPGSTPEPAPTPTDG